MVPINSKLKYKNTIKNRLAFNILSKSYFRIASKSAWILTKKKENIFFLRTRVTYPSVVMVTIVYHAESGMLVNFESSVFFSA
jgi:hypothetical protein